MDLLSVIRVCTEIESLDYAAEMGVVSGYKQLQKIIGKDKKYLTLHVLLEEDQGHGIFLQERIAGIQARDIKTEYENEKDMCIFVYLIVLQATGYNISKDLYTVSKMYNLWWSKKLINELMNPRLF